MPALRQACRTPEADESRMRIMEIISAVGLNGAAVHCLHLCRDLGARGHDITLVCRPGAWIAGQLAESAVHIVASDLHRLPPDELRRVSRIAGERGIDVVHTHMSRAHFFGVLLRCFSRLPIVATAHNWKIQPHWMFNHRVIAVSQHARRFHQLYNFVRSSRIDVVHNFIDCARFQLPQHTRTQVRERLGVPEAVPVIGVVGRIIPAKGVADAVAALPVVRGSLPAARLLIAGDGEPAYLAQLAALTQRLGVDSAVIWWTGSHLDIPTILSALDLVWLPSHRETFPLVAAEAMAAGLPVVATAVGGLPECVTHGDTGLLVPAQNHEALARAAITLLSDPELRQRFGQAGRRRVLENFSPQRQVPRIEAILAAAAGSARTGVRPAVSRAPGR